MREVLCPFFKLLISSNVSNLRCASKRLFLTNFGRRHVSSDLGLWPEASDFRIRRHRHQLSHREQPHQEAFLLEPRHCRSPDTSQASHRAAAVTAGVARHPADLLRLGNLLSGVADHQVPGSSSQTFAESDPSFEATASAHHGHQRRPRRRIFPTSVAAAVN